MSNNEFTGNAGNDSITGGGGDDTAIYSGAERIIRLQTLVAVPILLRIMLVPKVQIRLLTMEFGKV